MIGLSTDNELIAVHFNNRSVAPITLMFPIDRHAELLQSLP